uniref:Uncharacterized protein n=1 Tax=Schistosoma haematobium TaxID=6185 RepID=A0A095A7Y6_SCHHA
MCNSKQTSQWRPCRRLNDIWIRTGAFFSLHRPAVKNFEGSHEFEERLKKLSSDEPFFFLIKPANSILEVMIGMNVLTCVHIDHQ